MNCDVSMLKKEKKEKKSKKDKYHDAQGHFVSKLKSPPRVKTGYEETNGHSNGLSNGVTNGYTNGSQTLPNPKRKKEKKRSKSRSRDEESRSVSRAESRASRSTTASGQNSILQIFVFQDCRNSEAPRNPRSSKFQSVATWRSKKIWKKPIF